jgi:hypothetical protein
MKKSLLNLRKKGYRCIYVLSVFLLTGVLLSSMHTITPQEDLMSELDKSTSIFQKELDESHRKLVLQHQNDEIRKQIQEQTV